MRLETESITSENRFANVLEETLDLNDLESGVVSLNAPAEQGAIQIGSFDPSRTSVQLDVHIEPETVSVTRGDGGALQIISYFDIPPDAPAEDACIVLAEPLGRMTLRRHICVRDRWRIDEVEITKDNRSDLTSFAEVIGEYAFLKQKSR